MPTTIAETGELMSLRITQIRTNPQDRTKFDPTEIAQLAASIAKRGLIQPITVRPSSDGDGYELIAGERRYRAHLHLGWDTIRAMVVPMGDEDASAVQIMENVQRVDLDPMDEARAYGRRLTELKMDVDALAEWVGKPSSYVAARLALLELQPEYQHLVSTGALTVSHARAMVPLDADRRSLAFAALTRGNGLSLWQFQKLCERLLVEQQEQPLFDPDSFFQIEDLQADARKVGLIKMKDLVAVIKDVRPIMGRLLEQLPDAGWLDADELERLGAFVDEMDHAITTRG